MVKQRQGKIIDIASEYFLFGSGRVPSYCASKGALVQLTKSMAIELAPFDIVVNAIVPGWIETDMTAHVKTMPLNQEIITRTPAGRWGSPADLPAPLFFWLPELPIQAADLVKGRALGMDSADQAEATCLRALLLHREARHVARRELLICARASAATQPMLPLFISRETHGLLL
jgi:2-dehydro-3-deoxy-D-gluconate 5-dehydrogenase